MAFEPELRQPKTPEKKLYRADCIYCGQRTWLDPYDAGWRPVCCIDVKGRNCQGRCSQYRPRWWKRLLNIMGETLE